jgi:hypothetical protein
MKRQIVLILLSLIVPGCKEQSKEIDNSGSYKEQSKVVDDSISHGSNNQHAHKEMVSHNVSSEMLPGAWFKEGDSNAVFSISSDSIFYVDNSGSYAYEITADTIQIKFDGWISKSLILKATKDSLVLMDIRDRWVTYFIR